MLSVNQNGNSNIMPLLMNFTTPSPIQDYTPGIFNYDEENQVSYEMRIIGTRCLRSHSTKKKSAGTGVISYSDKKNEIDVSKTVK